MSDTLVVETPRPGTVVLRLNRPERLNALNEDLVSALRDACAAVGADPEARVVVLTGTGRGFCAGLDLRGFGPSAPDASAPTGDLLGFQEMMGSLPGVLRAVPQPVIAAVNGPAVGGGMALSLAADIRVCAASASFGNAAIRLGLSGAEMGMSYHLPRIVGAGVAADWMLTGRTVSADEAYRCGLVSAVVDDDGLLDHALGLAAQIAEHTPLGVRLTKRALQVNVDAPNLDAALELENRNQVIAASTPESIDARVGMVETVSARGPLNGIRLVMLGGLGPGPFCGMVLGDLGADIVRVDRVNEVDLPPPVDVVMRRSQRSIAVDLKDPRGVDLVRDLVRDADGFVDVYRPGVAERLGLGPDDLIAINPRLVYARMTGYGQDGPYAQMAGHDINYIALSGALHAIGTPDTPVPPLNILGDFGGGGMLLAVGLLSGILESRRSGTGQVIDVSMLDGAATLMAAFYGMLDQGTWRDRRQANIVDGAAHFYRTYETADGKHFAVGALEPQFYAELCARLGVAVPHDDDDPETWAAHGEVIAARFREKTRGEWEAELVTPQSCAAPVLSLTEAPLHPQNRARATFVEVDGVVQPAPRAARFSRTVVPVPGGPALPGAQTVSVLADLGLDDDTVRDLRAAGVVRQRA